MKLPNGTQVIVGVELGKSYDVSLNEQMIKYSGQEATITNFDGRFYSLNIDRGEWSWSDDMLKGVSLADYDEEYKIITGPTPQSMITNLNTFLKVNPKYVIIEDTRMKFKTDDSYVLLKRTTEQKTIVKDN